MKILQVVPVFTEESGGTTTVVRSISKELAKKHEVTVYTMSNLANHGIFPEIERTHGYDVCYFGRSFKSLSRSGVMAKLNISFEMAKALKHTLSNFDVIHIHSWHQASEIMVRYYANRLNIPYVLQVHGSLHRFNVQERLKCLYNFVFGNAILRDASKVIAFSEEEAQEYKAMGVPNWKIDIIPNGLDLSKYSNLPMQGSFKRRLNLQSHTRTILYLGRINRTKGIKFIVEAYAHLIAKKASDVVLVIAGPDDGYLAELRKFVNSLGLSNLVFFTGLLSEEEKLSAFVDSDFCIYPSPFEPFGLVTLEAAACGTPVIVAKGTPLAKLVDRYEFGFSIEYGDIFSLSQLLRKRIGDPFLKKMGENGQSLVSKMFDYSKIITKLEEAYRESIDHKTTTKRSFYY